MMFTIKKIVSPFLLPPGFFILILLAVGLVGLLRRNWRLGVLNLLVGFGLYALSITPVANMLIRGLESDIGFPASYSGDVIVLLGGGTIQRVPDLTGTAAPSPLMMGRIVTAVRLYRQTQLPIIVTGGRTATEDVSEAQVAERFLMDLGVPQHLIIKEENARDTAENARFTAAICREKGFSRPMVITSAYHLHRSLMAFKAQNMDVTPVPAYFLGTADKTTKWRDLLPRASSLFLSSNALHEYIGIWYYRITG
jgi:uncharacterized SAM-binding protein YcdF (DUF218 family)